MPMERYSILAGNCYLDRFGVTFEVKAVENEQVSFITFQKTTNGDRSTSQQMLPMAKFIEHLQEQVPCPSSKSWR